MSDQIFKAGYEGPRPAARLSAPEKQTFLQQKARLVRRLHDAMLTLAAQDGMDRLGFGSGSPAYIQEWGDRIGEEQQEPERARFRPTAAQVSDMDGALQLLEGLRPAYFKVVMLRALHEFARDNREPGDWPWAKIGAFFGMSDRWAESAYDAAIVQAARRAGILDMAPADHAVLVCAVWVNHGWLCHLGTSADPRQDLSNMRGKSPVRLETAFALWTAGKPVAKRLVDETKPAIRNLLDHGAWYKSHPDALAELLIGRAREVGTTWHLEDLDQAMRRAA